LAKLQPPLTVARTSSPSSITEAGLSGSPARSSLESEEKYSPSRHARITSLFFMESFLSVGRLLMTGRFAGHATLAVALHDAGEIKVPE
jgi:hypothetical protein